MSIRAARLALLISSCSLLASAASAQNVAAPLGDSARRMTVPEGFRVSLFAGEPNVLQPIALTFDPRGRLWVAECFSYPTWEMNGKPGRDRITILEDTDGDGQFDTRKVFLENGTNISGVEVGFGGVWVCSTPNLLFYPDKDGDDRPDGPPEVVLDGWSLKARHNVFNGLIWGPDGWLYGCNGILSESRVGKPGTPDGDRVPMNCGVWRLHPTRRVFETVAHGTTNPWGLDFDDRGEAFITNCVIPHLFHVIPGAHFQRMFGNDISPYSYGLLESCADHIHWAGGHWTDSRGGVGKHGEAGGGHAHSGAMVYLGDNWPDSYRDSVLTCNIHGARLNRDPLKRSGSGYVATHAKDFLFANDPWFRGIALKTGPDGSAFVIDWSDTGECHEDDADGAHRENGRVYKVSFGTPKPVTPDLARLDDDALVTLQTHKNDWYVRQSRRLLQERAASERDLATAHASLRAMLHENPDATRKLRALWALHATGGLDAATLDGALKNPGEDVRSWAIRLLVDDRGHVPSAESLGTLALLSRSDPSAKVRLSLASALQRLPLDRRAAIAEGLMSHAEDAHDPNLPLMDWYGIEPLVPVDLSRAADWASTAAIPLVRKYLARRAVAADIAKGLAALVTRMGREPSPMPGTSDVLDGITDALRGRRSVPMPEGWPALAERLDKGGSELGRRSARLSLIFGEPRAVDRLRALLADTKAAAPNRVDALNALTEARVSGLAADLIARLDDPELRGPAIRALTVYDDPAVPGVLLGRFNGFPEPEKEDAVQTLAARPEWVIALLDAVEKGTVPRRLITVAVARQIQAFHRKPTDEALARVWGSYRPSNKETAAAIGRYKATLTPEALRAADLSRGRAVFEKSCRQCHKLYETGGDVGPDLTGSNRDNLDYVLGNVLDPGAVVAKDYQLTTVSTKDGRLVSGIVRERNDASIVIRTVNDRVIVPRDEIEAETTAKGSMMPDGLFDSLKGDEVRDLMAYLMSKVQAPLPTAAPR